MQHVQQTLKLCAFCHCLPFVMILFSQLTSSFLRPFVGERGAPLRAAYKSRIAATFATRFACATNPHFNAALQGLAHAAYPQWYLRSFVTSVPVSQPA
jgi:hypothetical protein